MASLFVLGLCAAVLCILVIVIWLSVGLLVVSRLPDRLVSVMTCVCGVILSAAYSLIYKTLFIVPWLILVLINLCTVFEVHILDYPFRKFRGDHKILKDGYSVIMTTSI